MRIIVSDTTQGHGDACKATVLLECPTAQVDVRVESLTESISYAIAQGDVDIISRSTEGLSDGRISGNGKNAHDNGIGLVHAHGNNSHVPITNPSYVGQIVACGRGDGAGNNAGSYGPGLEFFYDDELTESHATARIAGIIAQLMIDKGWSFDQSRQALRQTASLWVSGRIDDGGWGYIDKVAAAACTPGILNLVVKFDYSQEEFHGYLLHNHVTFTWENINNLECKIVQFNSAPSYHESIENGTIIGSSSGESIQIIFDEVGTKYIGIYGESGNDYTALEICQTKEVEVNHIMALLEKTGIETGEKIQASFFTKLYNLLLGIEEYDNVPIKVKSDGSEFIIKGELQTEKYNRKKTILYQDNFSFSKENACYASQLRYNISNLSIRNGANYYNDISSGLKGALSLRTGNVAGDSEGTMTHLEVAYRENKHRLSTTVTLASIAETFDFYFGFNRSVSDNHASGDIYAQISRYKGNWILRVNDGNGEQAQETTVALTLNKTELEIWVESDGTIHWAIDGVELETTSISDKMQPEAHYIILGHIITTDNLNLSMIIHNFESEEFK